MADHDTNYSSFMAMASCQDLLHLPPESAAQCDVKKVNRYNSGQGAKVVEPLQIEAAGFCLTQALGHERGDLGGAFCEQADRMPGT